MRWNFIPEKKTRLQNIHAAYKMLYLEILKEFSAFFAQRYLSNELLCIDFQKAVSLIIIKWKILKFKSIIELTIIIIYTDSCKQNIYFFYIHDLVGNIHLNFFVQFMYLLYIHMHEKGNWLLISKMLII